MILPVASVVTNKTTSEFDLLKHSLEQYHDCTWVLSCDEIAYNKYQDVENIKCLNLIASDDCDHNTNDEQKKDSWMKVMMTKFDAVEDLMNTHGHALFLDSDMVFVNPIEDVVLNLFQDPQVDAAICQHMTNNWPVEAQHGLYNGGMFHMHSHDFLNAWRSLSNDYKKHGLYFEQQPLEFIQRNFLSLNLPINYNIGWWRFNNPQTRDRLHQLRLKDDKIYFGNRPAVNFHVHTSRDLEYENFGQFLVDKVVGLLEQSSNASYKSLLKLLAAE